MDNKEREYRNEIIELLSNVGTVFGKLCVHLNMEKYTMRADINYDKSVGDDVVGMGLKYEIPEANSTEMQDNIDRHKNNIDEMRGAFADALANAFSENSQPKKPKQKIKGEPKKIVADLLKDMGIE